MAVPSLTYNVIVNSTDVEMMFARTMLACSEESFMAFLQGPAEQYFHEEIGLRFAYEGDRKSGNWPPLAEATNRIREALGFDPVTPINIRTGALEEFVTESSEFMGGPHFAQMDIPGQSDNSETARKLRVAQRGAAAGENPWPLAGSTPPRPVLAFDEEDVAFLLESLETHIVNAIIGLL